jgi:hypothetical protein
MFSSNPIAFAHCFHVTSETIQGGKKATKQQMANFKTSLNHHHHNFLCRMVHTVKSTLEYTQSRGKKEQQSQQKQQKHFSQPHEKCLSHEPQKFD